MLVVLDELGPAGMVFIWLTNGFRWLGGKLSSQQG
jgi:hypothetical protein